MNTGQGIKNTLVEVDESVLIVIDVQDSFLRKYDNALSQEVVDRIVWLLQTAILLNIPVVAMAEDIAHSGGLNRKVHDALPEGTVIHDKDAFGLTYNVEILAAVKATGHKTAILVGTETDVCVSQSALGLIDRGYQVVVVKDAVATTEGDEETGLSRMREAGAAICSVKSLYYEWLRSVTNCRRLVERAPELEYTQLPDSLVL
ncbi:MAG: isochorismatase family protein [Gammaproteobacteria bacterium]|nr:isochorismatase family protein [Gammaproteobacteria bacterium]